MARPFILPEKVEFKILNSISDYATRPTIEKIVQRAEKITGPRLSRILKYLQENKEFIIKIPKSYPQAFELTVKGRQRLKELQFYVIHDHPPITLNRKPLFSLDNYSVLYPIVKAGEIYTPNEVQMNGWIQKIDSWKDVTIRVNGTKSLSVEPLAMFGENQDRLLMRARAVCDNAATILQEQFGFILGVGHQNKKPTIEVCTPETMAAYKDIGYVKDYLDASKMKGEAVFEGVDDADAGTKAQNWLEAPGEISLIKKELMYVHEANNCMISTLAQLIHTIGDQSRTINQLTMAVNTLTSANIQSNNLALATLTQEPAKEQERVRPPPGAEVA